jgi:hypothetical protein
LAVAAPWEHTCTCCNVRGVSRFLHRKKLWIEQVST